MKEKMRIELATLDNESIKNILNIMPEEELKEIIKFSINLFAFTMVVIESLKKHTTEETAKEIGIFVCNQIDLLLLKAPFVAGVSWESIKECSIDGVPMSEIIDLKMERNNEK